MESDRPPGRRLSQLDLDFWFGLAFHYSHLILAFSRSGVTPTQKVYGVGFGELRIRPFRQVFVFHQLLLLEPRAIADRRFKRRSFFQICLRDVFGAASEKRNGGSLNHRRPFTSFYRNELIFAEYVRGQYRLSFFNQSLISVSKERGRRHRDRAARVPKHQGYP
jgi:hypothetical protein